MFANVWNLPPPPGFQGLREDLPLRTYLRHLPHWRQDGATYFVTFRLADSLPREKLNELAGIRDEWDRNNPKPRSKERLEELARTLFERVERWLDLGSGSCVLRNENCAAKIIDAMHHFDGSRYELGSYVVMPNHVHVIVRPVKASFCELEDILKSWKAFSARRINALIGESGDLWQQESFDRIIRDEEHLWRTIHYIGRNEQAAGLPRNSCPYWIRPEWAALGWKCVE